MYSIKLGGQLTSFRRSSECIANLSITCAKSECLVLYCYNNCGRKNQRMMGFGEAARNGLVDQFTGSYVNNVTGERLFPAEAIPKGFFEATNAEDMHLRQMALLCTNVRYMFTGHTTIRQVREMSAYQLYSAQ